MSASIVAPAASGVKKPWRECVLIIFFAALLRLAFFPGGLGTDEIDYLSRAYYLLQGQYPHAHYIGDMRDGINAYLALSLWLFGPGTAGAAGLFFVCSLGQVALGFAFANYLWGREAAIWTGLIQATIPVEISQAGDLSPDPYLGFVIALSIVLFYLAEQKNHRALYFLSGITAGWVFWIKQVVILYGLVFLFFAARNRRPRVGWAWFGLGGLLSLIGHLALFYIIYGDPLYFFEAYYRFVGEAHIAADSRTDTSLLRYLIWLFIEVYHTGLLGWMALAAVIFGLRRRDETGVSFVSIWAVGLLVIFSVFPISFSPLKFIAKQSNYMDLFILPLVMLSGWFLAQQGRAVAYLLGGIMIVSGVLLGALEQQVVSTVTANGRAAAAFAEAHSGISVFGPLTAQRQSELARLLRGSLDGAGDIRPVGDLARLAVAPGAPDDIVAFVIEDPAMRNWPGARREGDLPALRACRHEAGELVPADLGLGRRVVGMLRYLSVFLPTRLGAAVEKRTEPLWRVDRAQIYAVTRECARMIQSATPPDVDRSR